MAPARCGRGAAAGVALLLTLAGSASGFSPSTTPRPGRSQPASLRRPRQLQEQQLQWQGRHYYVGVAAAATGGDAALSPDIVVIGGGVAGLTTALEAARRGSGRVVVLSRDVTEAASNAAGGMIAPQSERLGNGPNLELALEARAVWMDWLGELEVLVRAGGGAPSGPEEVAGLVVAGGFIAPAFAGDAVEAWRPPPDAGAAHWLDAAAVRQFEPSLSDEVVGGWWFPEDFQVDPRLLMASLRRACNFAGVSIVEGPAGTATQLIPDSTGRRIAEVRTESGMRFTDPEAVVVANGAWLRQLLPLPVTPHKGQMLALRPPPVATASSLGPTPQDSTPPSPLLTRTLFAESCYIIPKSDGRVVVGATVEPGRWDLRSTAAGVATLLGNAVDTCPELAEWEVVDTWAGLRPTTPDYLPILGRLDGYLENVYAVS